MSSDEYVERLCVEGRCLRLATKWYALFWKETGRTSLTKVCDHHSADGCFKSFVPNDIREIDQFEYQDLKVILEVVNA